MIEKKQTNKQTKEEISLDPSVDLEKFVVLLFEKKGATIEKIFEILGY